MSKQYAIEESNSRRYVYVIENDTDSGHSESFRFDTQDEADEFIQSNSFREGQTRTAFNGDEWIFHNGEWELGTSYQH